MGDAPEERKEKVIDTQTRMVYNEGVRFPSASPTIIISTNNRLNGNIHAHSITGGIMESLIWIGPPSKKLSSPS